MQKTVYRTCFVTGNQESKSYTGKEPSLEVTKGPFLSQYAIVYQPLLTQYSIAYFYHFLKIHKEFFSLANIGNELGKAETRQQLFSLLPGEAS